MYQKFLKVSRPKISFTLRGLDRFGRKTLYLRYAYDYDCNYISTGYKLLPHEWDKSLQIVKANAFAGGAQPSRINMELKDMLSKAYAAITELTDRSIGFHFDDFQAMFIEPVRKDIKLFDAGAELLDELLIRKEIAESTKHAYYYSLVKFKALVGDLGIFQVNKSVINDFKTKAISANGANMANQYIRNVAIVFRGILKKFNLSIDDPFKDVKIKVERISEKKILTETEYRQIIEYFIETAPGSMEFELLRRFLLMCRGVRYSDTNLFRREHFFEFQDQGKHYRYLLRPSQKTEGLGIVPILESDIDTIIIWQPDGSLFPDMHYSAYRWRFAKLSKDIVGRKLTSHFGRHWAGDSLLNAPDGSLDDVKKVLGIASDKIAKVYAQHDIKKLLDKVYGFLGKK